MEDRVSETLFNEVDMVDEKLFALSGCGSIGEEASGRSGRRVYTPTSSTENRLGVLFVVMQMQYSCSSRPLAREIVKYFSHEGKRAYKNCLFAAMVGNALY